MENKKYITSVRQSDPVTRLWEQENNYCVDTMWVTPREYDGGFVDNPKGECTACREIPSGILYEAENWLKRNVECNYDGYGRITYYILYSLDENGNKKEPLIKAYPVFTVIDKTGEEHGHYTRFNEAQAVVDKLWNISHIEASINVRTKLKDLKDFY